jgi:epoxide hydrolase-like predicted phosphatase
MPHTIKAIAFDFGGVIDIKDGGDVFENIAQILDIPRDTFAQAYFAHNHLSNVENMPWQDMIQKVVGMFTQDQEKIQRIGAILTARYEHRKINTELLKLFPFLRGAGLKIAIFSNATSELRKQLEELHITETVDEVVISGEIGFQKPDPRAFKILCEKLNVNPEELIFTDDTPKSLETADKIGYTPILFKNNEQLKAGLLRAGIACGSW